MANAVIWLHHLQIPGLRAHLSGCGDPEHARKLFKRACYRNSVVVKFEPERFLPLLIREFARECSVTLTTNKMPAFYTYSIDVEDDSGIPMLRIARNGTEPTLLYTGPFFAFLKHGLAPPKERKRYDPLQTKYARESRRVAKEQMLKEKVRVSDGSLRTPREQLTPLQVRLQNQALKDQKQQARIALGALRRHRRVRKLRKIKLHNALPSPED